MVWDDVMPYNEKDKSICLVCYANNVSFDWWAETWADVNSDIEDNTICTRQAYVEQISDNKDAS